MFCLLAVNAQSQNAFVTWSTFDIAFGIPQASNTVITSAVGQAFVGTNTQANTRLESGFLADSLLRGTLVAVNEDKPLPEVFVLEQNYPNPFNPVTHFGFRLPAGQAGISDFSAAGGSASGEGFVSLKVFDVLGRDVATLVNEVKQPGEYMVRWDADGFPSGVYFYRLTAGLFSDTKKLILLK